VFKTLLALSIMILATACSLQDGNKDKDNASVPGCTEDCDGDQVAAPTPALNADPAPTPDASQPPTPATQCDEDADCANGEECVSHFCVPQGIVPVEPECDEDSDCASGCECQGGECVPEGTPGDETAPVITNVTVTNITQTSVTVNWTTNEAAHENHVAYLMVVGDTQLQVGFTVDDEFRTTHSTTLMRLSPATDYSFYVLSKDAAGNQGQSENYAFKTAYATGPVRSDGANRLLLNRDLVNQSECVDVKGNLPGTNWSATSIDLVPSEVVNGTWVALNVSSASNGVNYTFSYRDIACDRSVVQGYVNLAPSYLKTVSPEDLKFVGCTWFDGSKEIVPADQNQDGKITDVDYYCNLRFTKDANGIPVGTGNMSAYAQ